MNPEKSLTKFIGNTAIKVAKALGTIQEGRHSSGSIAYTDSNYYRLDPDFDLQINKSEQRTYLELFQKLMSVYKGVNTTASAAASVPLKIWKPVSLTEREEFRIHPIYKLLKNPNNLNTQNELFVKTFAYLELTGNAYWFLERDEYELPKKIHCPRPDRIEIIPTGNSDDDFVFERKRSTGGTETWSMRDVVHFSYFNSLSDHIGYGPVQAGTDNAILDLYLVMFGKRFFENAINPSKIFGSTQKISDEAYERLKAELRRQHVGVEFFHRVLLLEEDIRPIADTNKSPADAEFTEVKKNSVDDILTLLGVYHVVALRQNKSASTISDAKRMFWEEIKDMRLANVAATIEKELISQYPQSEDLEVEFYTAGISGLRASALEESLAHYRYWQMGSKTANEIRREIGMSGKVLWGDDMPPTLGVNRSAQMGLPNNERADFEDSINHPENYVDQLSNKLYNKISDNGGRDLDADYVKEMIQSAVSEMEMCI